MGLVATAQMGAAWSVFGGPGYFSQIGGAAVFRTVNNFLRDVYQFWMQGHSFLHDHVSAIITLRAGNQYRSALVVKVSLN